MYGENQLCQDSLQVDIRSSDNSDTKLRKKTEKRNLSEELRMNGMTFNVRRENANLPLKQAGYDAFYLPGLLKSSRCSNLKYIGSLVTEDQKSDT